MLSFKLCFLSLFLSLFVLSACDDYDTFTTDRSSTLSFSRDSIIFDTLLTTVPSSTQTLAVYNRGDEGLRISEVWLEKGTSSPFRINIDGQDMSRSTNNHVEDFEVRRRDSIIIRAEVTLPEWGDDSPQLAEDVLRFRLESGVEQQIVLQVVGRDAFFLRACTLTTDTTFSARRPIVVYDSLVVGAAATLSLPAGTQLYFHDGAGLIVRGKMIAKGTLDDPVVLRGDRTDHMFDYLPYDNLPSRWGGVVFKAESYGNELDYVDLHSGLYGISCDSSLLDERKLLLTNSIIHNLGGDGLYLKHCRVEVSNTEISNTLGHCVYQIGGDATFLHCTLAQFYPLSAARDMALTIACEQEEGYYTPLVRADYQNCVITGYEDDVILFPALAPDSLLPQVNDPQINYYFANCFLATEIPEDEIYSSRFQGNKLDVPTSVDLFGNSSATEADSIRHEKNFVLFDTHNFLYDFTPKESSPIRGVADPTKSALFPTDRLGRNRLADGSPDAGCYEFVKAED
ncbi:MAG: hypothetical protein K6C30_00785 [Bacteroidaceae bacterium]|nr:hypothetical protein [Bacteroidaceae bacterium]